MFSFRSKLRNDRPPGLSFLSRFSRLAAQSTTDAAPLFLAAPRGDGAYRRTKERCGLERGIFSPSIPVTTTETSHE